MKFLDALVQIGVSYEESVSNIKAYFRTWCEYRRKCNQWSCGTFSQQVKKQVNNTFDRYEPVKDNVLSAKEKAVDDVKNIFDNPNDQLLSTHKWQSMSEKVVQTAKEMGVEIQSND